MTSTRQPRSEVGNQSTAVYYPHTSIRSEALLKTALLLWDYVECIVPDAGFRDPRPPRRSIQEATEILVRNTPPSDFVKRAVHLRLEGLLRDGLPDWLKRTMPDEWRANRQYLIYGEKLAHETWRLLRDV